MRINSLYAHNFMGSGDVKIEFNGYDATISGQNGSGKTTIANIYCWLMTGKMYNGKSAEIANIHNGGKISAIVEFDNGMTFSRESNSTSKFYVNGLAVKMNEYFGAINAMTNGALNVLATPFNFSRLNWKDLRNALIQIAGNISTAEVIAADSSLHGFDAMLGKFTPEQFMRLENDKLKTLNAEIAVIPARIDELQNQLESLPNGDVNAIKAQIAQLKANLDAKTDEIANFRADNLLKACNDIESGIAKSLFKIDANNIELKRLREDYHNVTLAMQGTCPVCGSTVPADNVEDLKARLEEITASGKKIAQSNDILAKSIEAAKFEAEQLKAHKPDNSIADAIKARDDIQDQINDAESTLRDIKLAYKVSKRIEKLRERQGELANDIADCERRIFTASNFIKRKITLIESSINAKFDFVKFKLFEDFKTVDGVKECCEATINGVPYNSNLSKGERLKAALDVVNAFQKHYKVELPIIIDDAESYTSNSFVELPNQLIQLKAVEGKALTIEVAGERRVTA